MPSYTRVVPVPVITFAIPALAWWIGIGASVLAADGTGRGSTETNETVVGITSPFRSATLASVHSGQIADLAVPEGGVVRKGELVFALDDRVQRARTQIAQARAESNLEVDLAAARWGQAKGELERLLALYVDSSASPKELRDARIDADVARLEYEVARFQHDQDIRAHEHERRVLEQFQIRAPFTGYVAQHVKQLGETVDQTEAVAKLAQLDPLLVSVDCPLSMAPLIREGDRVRVRPVDPQWEPRLATVTLASRVADGASQTFKVKLSVDNKDAGWVSGLKVLVEFPNKEALPGESNSLSSLGNESRRSGGGGE